MKQNRRQTAEINAELYSS